MNSFIQNVNYIAGLDNQYGDQVYLLKNNLTLMNTANDIKLSFKYFDFEARKVKEINHDKSGVLYTGLSLVLQEFIDKINLEIGTDVLASYELLNLTIGFTITVVSNNENIKIHELNFNAKKTQDQVELYNLYGEVKNTLSILPTLAMLDKSVTDEISIAVHYIDDILTVTENIDNVITVSEDIDNVNTVGSNMSSVLTVNDNIDNVNITANNIGNVNTVASDIDIINEVNDNLPQINIVHDNVDDVRTVADNILNVNEVVDNMEDINIVKDNMTDVKTVSTNMDSVNIISYDIAKVITVSDNVENINKVVNDIDNVNIVAENIDSIIIDANNIVDINTVASNIDIVETVAINIGNIEDVASNTTNINTIADNIHDINSVIDNIVDIQNAEENALIAIEKADIATTKAQEASDSELMSYKWAEHPENAIVRGTLGTDDEYSSYHWAKKAKAIVVGDIGIVDLNDIDTTGLTDGGMIRFDQSQLKWLAYDFSHNDTIGFNIVDDITVSKGQLGWNKSESTLNLGLSDDVDIALGQGSVRVVRNDTASTIFSGSLVMFDGILTGSRIKVKPFTGQANDAIYCYGIASQDILAGTDGIISIEGKVKGINTSGTSVGETWLEGNVLYASATGNGMMTNVVPGDGDLRLPVAFVVNADASGTLEVRLTPINENLYYTKEQSDMLLRYKVPLNGDFILDLGEM